MRQVFVYAAAIALVCAVAADHVGAQTLLSASVRADNDAFDFWLAPYDRPDEEYTSGVRATLVYSGAAPWEKRWHRDLPACKAGSVERCATHSFAFGQDMYTGKLVPGDTTRVAGSRPNAGWLYLQESSRIATLNRLDESSITIGVTGPPALGEEMQSFFHALAPNYNRPINWNVQIPFEPGVVAAYDRTQRVLAFGGGATTFGGDFEPHAGASLGNILTEARAGLRVRMGIALQHPWLQPPKGAEPELSVFADATVHGVARNEFLMGTLFRDSPHVTERPFVTEYSAGVTARVEHVRVTYRADQVSSEYLSRPNGHAWGRLELEWDFER